MIVVTTPTGQIGSQVAANLIGQGEPVRVIVRDASRLPSHVRDRVEVIEGSHGDAAVVNTAFAGADAVFWVIPPDFHTASLEATYIDFTRPATEAFVRHGVKRVVGVSALGRGVSDHAGLVTASLAMDDLIASTGVSYRALAMPSFIDNILRQVQPIKHQGMFFSPLDGDRKLPTCTTSDIARVATKWLLDPSWTGHGSVAVLGPEDLSNNDLARIMSEALSRQVRFQQISMDAFKAGLRERGASETMARGMADMMQAKNAGLDNAEVRTSSNTTPTSFRQWCEEVLKPAVDAPNQGS